MKSTGTFDVFDSHRHFGNWGPCLHADRLIDPFHTANDESPAHLAGDLERHRVSCAVVVPVYTNDPLYPYSLNTKLIDIAERLGESVIPGLWVDPTPQTRRELRLALKVAESAKVFVLKTSPSAWPDPYSPAPSTWDRDFRNGIEIVAEYLQNSHGILQVHTGSGKSDIRLIEQMLRTARPKFTVQLVHMGNNASGHFYLMPRLAEWVDQGLEVVCDTSWSCGFAIRWLKSILASNPGLADHVLFASDEPWGIFESEIAKITSTFGDEPVILSKILFGNALRLYGRRQQS